MLSSLFPLAHSRYTALPLVGGFLEGFCVWLHAKGYPADAIGRRMEVARLLEAALRRRGVRSVRDLTASALRSCIPPRRRFRAAIVGSLVRSLARYLEERGELAPPAVTPTQHRVAAYRRHLERVRGLSPASVALYTATVAAFLAFVGHDVRPQRLREVCAADIEAFLAATGRRVARRTLGHVAGELRAYLRFLAAAGDVPMGLDAHVGSPRVFRGERLPRALPWETVRTFLRSIDRSTPKGRRDHAVFLLIATYGLRVSEVAGLRLDDVAWRAREIRVARTKVGTPLLLPLTDEVAAALFEYLRRGRPASADRHVFLRVEAPLGPIQGSTITAAFHAWARRVGIQLPAAARIGPHCLRHALAMRLLRQGARLKTIGDLLGHRLPETTAIYLRLDVDDLRDVALPLPAATLTAQVRP